MCIVGDSSSCGQPSHKVMLLLSELMVATFEEKNPFYAAVISSAYHRSMEREARIGTSKHPSFCAEEKSLECNTYVIENSILPSVHFKANFQSRVRRNHGCFQTKIPDPKNLNPFIRQHSLLTTLMSAVCMRWFVFALQNEKLREAGGKGKWGISKFSMICLSYS